MAQLINLLKLDSTSHSFLTQLLANNKGKISFEAGSYWLNDEEIILSHKIVMHQNSTSTKEVYEVLDSKPYAKGCFGELYLSLVTLSFKEEELQVKIKPEEKQRLVKAQQLKYVTKESAQREVNNLLALGIFHCKPLSVDDEQSYITMRKLPGIPLMKLIEANQLTIKERYLLTRVLVLALKEEIYEQRLVHRDINPGNILIDEKFIARFVDLAFAIPKGYDDSQEHHGAIPYAAPECYSLYEWSTFKTDIYALGRVLMLLWGDDSFLNPDFHSSDVLWSAKHPTFNTLFARMEEIPACHADIKALLRSMLRADQFERPDFTDILASLDSLADKLDPIPNPNKITTVIGSKTNIDTLSHTYEEKQPSTEPEAEGYMADEDDQAYNDYLGFNNALL